LKRTCTRWPHSCPAAQRQRLTVYCGTHVLGASVEAITGRLGVGAIAFLACFLIACGPVCAQAFSGSASALQFAVIARSIPTVSPAVHVPEERLVVTENRLVTRTSSLVESPLKVGALEADDHASSDSSRAESPQQSVPIEGVSRVAHRQALRGSAHARCAPDARRSGSGALLPGQGRQGDHPRDDAAAEPIATVANLAPAAGWFRYGICGSERGAILSKIMTERLADVFESSDAYQP
jgi:hypothetical protein